MTETYDAATIRFHGASAFLVAAAWIVGQTADWFPKGPLRGAVWSTHFTLGGLLTILYVARLVWRFSGGRRLPGVGSPALVKLAAAGHGLLYLGIGIVIALGVANAFGHGSSVWGLFVYPKIFDESLRRPIGELHEWAANLLVLLAAAHAAVALVHQYVWRDGVLTRMWPGLAARS
jgi:cytochrome b561